VSTSSAFLSLSVDGGNGAEVDGWSEDDVEGGEDAPPVVVPVSLDMSLLIDDEVIVEANVPFCSSIAPS
jgi:hypothetical protein